MIVYVALYEHKHGVDVSVFSSEAKAHEWSIEIAEEYWDDWMDEQKPEDKDELASQYWEEVGDHHPGEYFSIYPKEVL